MKIGLIIPPSPNNKKIIRLVDCSHETKANYLWQPNDYLIITSLLKPEDKAFLVDGTCDALAENVFFEELIKFEGDILFFALSSVCWNSDYYFFKKVRQIFPNIPTFVIGDIFLEKHYQSLILNDCDGIVFHPYILDLDKMVKIKENKDSLLPGICTEAGQKVLSESKHMTYVQSKIPRHKIFLKTGYRFPFAQHYKFATVTTMWGCPFSCSYCTDSNFPPVVRSYEDVLKELQYLHELGVKELFFADKVFGFYHKNIFPLLEEMAKRFNFSWTCYFHPQIYNPKLLELMHSAGCHTIIIGIDSADISSLRQYNRTVSQQKLDDLLIHANRLNMNICADFILGLLHESEKDILSTIEYALKLPIDFASFNIAAPLPGSDIREKAIKEGNLILGHEGFDTSGLSGVLGNVYIDNERIKKVKKKAVRRFYLRPSYLLRRLKKTSSWEHFKIQIAEMVSLFKKIGSS